MQDYPIYLAIDTLAGNEIPGDYYEFGVFRGRSFSLVFRRLRTALPRKFFEGMRFVAFDSFAGLPETRDPAAPTHYHKGAYSYPRQQFERNVRRAGIGLDQLVVIPGFFDASLADPNTHRKLDGSKIALCYIDCDIYESTVPILDFIAPRLQRGTLLVIDDWNRHRSSDQFGIRRAVREWLAKNPQIHLTQLFLSKRVLFVVDFDESATISI